MQLSTVLTASLTDLAHDDPIHAVGPAPLAIIATAPDAVAACAHDKLHAYPFKDVPVCWRRLYEEATLHKVLRILRETELRPGGAGNLADDRVARVVGLLDMVLLLTGAPGRKLLVEELLRGLDTTPRAYNPFAASDASDVTGSEDDDESPRPHKRRRRRCCNHGLRTQQPSPVQTTFPDAFPTTTVPTPTITHPVSRTPRPSLTAFSTHMHASASPTPLILTGTIAHWPALRRWRSPRYWLDRTHAGARLVPVETGRSYTDAGWGQRICRFDEFLRRSLLGCRVGVQDVKEEEEEEECDTWYLAQHDLFHQIAALRSDIAVPDYCFVDPPQPGQTSAAADDSKPRPSPSPSPPPSPDPALHIWLGPAGTISPAHTDPHHNLLAQVVGRKYVRLFAPSQTPLLYPMTRGDVGHDMHEPAAAAAGPVDPAFAAVDMGNTSRVDVGFALALAAPRAGHDDERAAAKAAHDARYPDAARAAYVEALLEPGDVLFVPRGWWHYVRSVDVSASVSFWWD